MKSERKMKNEERKKIRKRLFLFSFFTFLFSFLVFSCINPASGDGGGEENYITIRLGSSGGAGRAVCFTSDSYTTSDLEYSVKLTNAGSSTSVFATVDASGDPITAIARIGTGTWKLDVAVEFSGSVAGPAVPGELYAIATDTRTLSSAPYSAWTVTMARGVRVSFDSNLGSSVDHKDIIDSGLVPQPLNPSRGGDSFGGWFTDNGTFSNQWTFGTDTVSYTTHTRNLTLYAGWNLGAAEAPNITTQPLSAIYTVGDLGVVALDGTATVSDGGSLTYQWYSNTTASNTGGTPIGGATGATYTPSVATAGIYHYYVVVTNTNLSAPGNQTSTTHSEVATIIVGAVTAPVLVDNLTISTLDQPYADLKTALDSIIAAGTYVVKVGEDQSLAPYTFSGITARNITLQTQGSPVTIQLSSNGALFTLGTNLTLTLDAGITLRGRNVDDNGADNSRALISIQTSGSLVMKAGSLITGNGGNSGGGVYIAGGTFKMQGGTISGNSSLGGGDSGNGGGVYISSAGGGGAFIMEGGIISGNSARQWGGGVVMHGGTFTMQGTALITGNTATSVGGGVSVRGGTFTMENGTISGNMCGNGGGGVHLPAGQTFNMKNGTISGNTALTYGGGIGGAGAFIMEGGIISGNTAGTYGGGVGTYPVTMHGGTISGNMAGTYGGGVGTSNFTMEGGTISGNTARTYGGGVYASGTFKKQAPGGGITTSGTITGYGDNTSTGNVVKDASGTVLANRGHAAYRSASMRKENTVGPNDHLDSTIAGPGGGW